MISGIDWDVFAFDNANNVDQSFSTFYNKLNNAIDKHA
jgi:hypothetical protein